MDGAPIAQLVDSLLGAQKSLAGDPDWREVGHRGEHRLVLPLFIGGRTCPLDLEINGYPNIRDLRFRIMLRMPQCIWRIDYVDDELHVNPPEDWPACGVSFTEPHYHTWQDNRRFASHSQVPDPLLVARILPPQLRSFDGVFRWFCDETNIAQPPSSMVYLPARNRLV
jgi:hypothetical protein